MSNYQDDFIEQLPHWAVSSNDGAYKAGAQLPTKDGRRVGNAVIAEEIVGMSGTCFVVITDAGSYLVLTPNELEELYYPSEFIVRDIPNIKPKEED